MVLGSSKNVFVFVLGIQLIYNAEETVCIHVNTGDGWIHKLIERTRENAWRIRLVLNEFGFGTLDFKETDATKKEYLIQLGYDEKFLGSYPDHDSCGFYSRLCYHAPSSHHFLST